MLHTKPSRRFVESLRRTDNCLKDMLMLLKNILGELRNWLSKISEKDWQLSSRFPNFSFFWVSGLPRNAVKGVNISRRFVESLRRTDNCLKDMLMLLKNILGELRNWLSIILGDSMNLREILTPFTAFLGRPLTQKKEKLGNRELNCQSFSEIRRRLVWNASILKIAV